MANREPDPNGELKEQWERRMARTMGKLLREQRARLDGELSLETGLPTMPSTAFWLEEIDAFVPALHKDLQKFMAEIALLELDAVFRRKQVAEDGPSQILERAIRIAAARARELSSVINQTTRKTVVQALREFFDTPGFTIGDAIDTMSDAFGPVRAQMIAVTEVTRSAREGQKITTGLIEEAGLEVIERWFTNNDGLVCPICAPRHGKEMRPSWEMPAHVNCRCWSTTQLAGVTVEDQPLAPALAET